MSIDRKPAGLFYGWWIVGACFLVSLYVGGVVLYGFTAIFEPIAEEFGWSYAQISFAASLRGLETGLFAPVLGILADRWGARPLMFGGAIITGLGMVLLSRINSLGMFWAAFGLIAAGTTACTATVLMTAISNWFKKKLGIAAGIVASGFGLSGIMVPVVAGVVDMFGWRQAMVIFALGMVVIGLPLSLLVRRTPEQYGYMPDGAITRTITTSSSGSDRPTPPTTTETDFGAKEAIMTRTFWHIALALTYQLLVAMSVATHVMPYLSSIGVSRSVSSLVASTTPVASIGGRLGAGWLADKFDKRRTTAIGLAMMCLGMFFFSYAHTGGMWLLVPAVIFIGVGQGSVITLRVSLLREYFGRKNFGTIHGFMVGIMMVGNVAGPPIAGWAFDTSGSYHGVWLAFAATGILAVILAATTPLVKTRQP